MQAVSGSFVAEKTFVLSLRGAKDCLKIGVFFRRGKTIRVCPYLCV